MDVTDVDEIVTSLARRYSTAIVLFHHAVGERVGLGPTDHKCLDVIVERGSLTGSELATYTGLTTGAVTGIVQRLMQHGLIERAPHPSDGRKQVLRPIASAIADVHDAIAPFRSSVRSLLQGFGKVEQAAIGQFLDQAAELAFQHAAALRSRSLADASAEGAA